MKHSINLYSSVTNMPDFASWLFFLFGEGILIVIDSLKCVEYRFLG